MDLRRFHEFRERDRLAFFYPTSEGNKSDPTYREVCTGETGHAEVIRIEYDPEVISFEDLLRVHFGTHDPSTLDQQGADHGTQYRSVIFFQNEEERRIAEEVIAEIDDLLDDEVVTEVTRFEKFHPAGDDHRNYYNENPDKGYCQARHRAQASEVPEEFPQFIEAGRIGNVNQMCLGTQRNKKRKGRLKFHRVVTSSTVGFRLALASIQASGDRFPVEVLKKTITSILILRPSPRTIEKESKAPQPDTKERLRN